MSQTTYGYRCRACDESFFERHEFGTAPHTAECPACQKQAGRDWSGTAVFPNGMNPPRITNGPMR